MMLLRNTDHSRWLMIALAAGALILTACSKELPSTPAPPAGTPVLLQVNVQPPNLNRKITIDGTVKNQSGRMVYEVQIGITVYRDDPFFQTVTDTSEVKIDSLPHGETQPFTTIRVDGDQFIDAFPVYSILPPTP